MNTDFLKKKVFGVPVLYVVALFVAILAVIAWRMKPNMTNAAEPEGATDGTNTDTITGDDNPYDMFRTQGTVTVQQGSDPATVTPVAIQTNEMWVRKGAEWLSHNGYAADSALTALTKYVSGDQLSLQEGQMRDKAIAQFGYPPETFTSGGTVAPTPTVPTAQPAVRQGNPPLIHKVVGSNDNTLDKIAGMYYGTADPKDGQNFLKAHNSQLPENGTLNVGTQVKVPTYEIKYYTTPSDMTAEQVAAKNGMSAVMVQRLNTAPANYVWRKGARVRVR